MLSTRHAVAALSALSALAVPAAAQADSISYVKDGNVFVTSPDGARTVQMTTAGGYSSASQADDGRIIALHGQRFHLIGRDGKVSADFTPVGSGTAGSIKLSGPFDPAISPDGTRVAYGFYVQYTTGDPNCGKPGGCLQGKSYAGTGYSSSSAASEWNSPGFKPEWGWADPSWIDNARTLIAAPDSAYISDVAVDDAGNGKATEWFSDTAPDSNSTYDAELNRTGTAVTGIANANGDHWRVWRVAGGLTKDTPPVPCLDAPAQGGSWSSPSFAPDGEHLVAAAPKGLYVATLPGLNTSCPDSGQVKVSLIELAGAKSPDWGPADVPAQPTFEQPKAEDPKKEQPVCCADPGPKTTPPVVTPVRVSSASKKLRTVLDKGLAVRATCGATITVKQGSAKLATARAACDKDTRIRFGRAVRKRLRNKARVALTIVATRGTERATATVTLRR